MKKIQFFTTLALLSLPLVMSNKVKAATTDNNDQVSQANVPASTTSSVNDYIKNNNLQYSGVKNEEAYSTFTAGKDYRYGRPEGIVIHETAEPNISAQEWADIFNNNWQERQAYVHAFVDHNGVVQTAPTDKTVWGAGYYANQRFIHVELCEENNDHDFAQSVNNDATYVANLLHQYNLTPSLAQADGTGTIWSHHDVSNYLGNTDHTDPDGYFALHNYSMDQFFDLIEQKYYQTNNQVVNEVEKNRQNVTKINDVVTINYHGRGKVAIWSNFLPGQRHVVKYLAPNTNWKTFKVATINGHTWYNLGGNQWLDGQYALLRSNRNVNKTVVAAIQPIKKIVTINYGGPGKVALWSSYDNTRKNIQKYLAPNTRWKAFKVVKYNGRTWYNLGGNQWLDGQYVK